MESLDFLKSSIRSEGGFALSDEVLDSFLSKGTLIHIPAKAYIIEPGTIDKSVWVTAAGVSKAIYFDGKKECVLGFSGPGTITLSPVSFHIGKPAFCGFQAVTNLNMLKVQKSDFDALMLESNEFARWMFGIVVGQFCAIELKAQMLSESDVISNYKNMLKRQMKLDENGFDPNRPNLLSIVSSKDIASYLGITQSYLSNLRKMFYEQQRQQSKK